MREIERDIVAAVIISKDNKILLGKKHADSGGVYIDCWHIPGGGVDNDLDLKSAIIREILEETGIDITDSIIKLLDDKGKGQSEKILPETQEKVICKMHFNVFKVNLGQKSNEVELKLDDDLAELKWVSIEDMEKMKLTPPSIELFSRIKISSLLNNS